MTTTSTLCLLMRPRAPTPAADNPEGRASRTHDNSTLNDPHECARRIVVVLKARGLWPSNGAGGELPSAREPSPDAASIHGIRSYPTQPPHRGGAAAARRVRQGAADTSAGRVRPRSHTHCGRTAPPLWTLRPGAAAGRARDRGRPDTDDTQAPARPRSYTTRTRGRVARERSVMHRTMKPSLSLS